MEFKPLNLAQLYQSADAGVAQAMQMNLTALQASRMKQEYDREDSLRALAKTHFAPDPETGVVSGDLRSFSKAAMTVDPLKAPTYAKMADEAEKTALERAKLQGDVDEQRRKGAQERLKVMGEASSVPYLKYKELLDGGMEEAEARKQVQPLYVQGVRNLVASGLFKEDQLAKFDLRPEFDPAVAEAGHRQVLGANGALEDFWKRKGHEAPKSELGKLAADLKAGKIDKPTHDAAVAKAVENSDWQYDAERAILVNKKTGATKAVDAPGGGAMPPKAADVESLRKEFNNREEVKNYNAAVPVWRSISKAPDTGAGDLDLIYGAGKILDPGSVVREGEMALTIKTGSPLQRILGTTKFSLEAGGRLTADTRQKLVEAMHNRVSELHTAATDARKPFEAQAKRQNIPLEETLTLPELPQLTKGKGKAKEPTTFDALPNAAQYRNRVIEAEDGTKLRSNGTEWVPE